MMGRQREEARPGDPATRGLIVLGLVAVVVVLSWVIGEIVRTTSDAPLRSEPLPSVSPLPQSPGQTAEDCPHEALCVSWVAEFGAGSPSVVVVVDGRVYARLESAVRRVRVLDPRTGDRLDVFDLAAPPEAREPPVVVLATTVPPQLHGVAADGQAWQIDVEGAGAMRPAVVGGVAYVGSRSGDLRAVALADGEVRWTHPAARDPLGLPVVAGDTVVVAAVDQSVVGVDPDNGEERWASSVPGHRYLVRPTATEDLAILTDGSGISALDGETGALRWRAELEWGRLTPPNVAGGHVYVVGWGADRVWAIDVDDGSVAWVAEDVTGALYPPVTIGDVVYVAGVNRRVHALDAATGRVLGATSLDAIVVGEPVPAGDHLLVPTARGIVALGGG